MEFNSEDEEEKNIIKKSEQKRIYQRLTENIQNKISNFKEGKSTKNHLNEQLIINICSLCRFLQKRKQEKQQQQIEKIINEANLNIDDINKDNLNNDNNLNETILDVFVPYSRLNKTLQMKLDSLNVVEEEENEGEFKKLEDNLIANEDEIIEENSDENVNKNLEYLYENRSMSMSLFNQPFENYDPFEQPNNFLKKNNKNDKNNKNKDNEDNNNDNIDFKDKKIDELSKGNITFKEHLKQKVIKTVINEMSYDYIFYMLGIFNKLNHYNKNDNNKPSDKKENLTFINIFKNFILELGVSDKKFYEQCVREIIYNKKNFSFNEFLDCFKRLFNLKYEQTFLKYKFLFQITPRKHADFIEEDELKKFYDLIRWCKKILDKDLHEKISNFLVSRYKKIFPKDEKLYTRKITMILELFFDIK